MYGNVLYCLYHSASSARTEVIDGWVWYVAVLLRLVKMAEVHSELRSVNFYTGVTKN